jgi:hypothetical protein
MDKSVFANFVHATFQTFEAALNCAEDRFLNSVVLVLRLFLQICNDCSAKIDDGDDQGAEGDRSQVIADGSPDGRQHWSMTELVVVSAARFLAFGIVGSKIPVSDSTLRSE